MRAPPRCIGRDTSQGLAEEGATHLESQDVWRPPRQSGILYEGDFLGGEGARAALTRLPIAERIEFSEVSPERLLSGLPAKSAGGEQLANSCSRNRALAKQHSNSADAGQVLADVG